MEFLKYSVQTLENLLALPVSHPSIHHQIITMTIFLAHLHVKL